MKTSTKVKLGWMVALAMMVLTVGVAWEFSVPMIRERLAQDSVQPAVLDPFVAMANSCPDSAADDHFCSQNPSGNWSMPNCSALHSPEQRGRPKLFTDNCKEPEPTNTLVPTNPPPPTLVPTNPPPPTEVPPPPTDVPPPPGVTATPTNEPEPGKTPTATPVVTRETKVKSSPTPTATIVYVEEGEECPSECVCVEIGPNTLNWFETKLMPWLEDMLKMLLAAKYDYTPPTPVAPGL